MIGFTDRLIADDLGFPVARLGWLFGAGQAGGVIGALLFGSLADRFRRVRMLVITCTLAAGFTAASLAAGNYQVLLICRVLTGIGLGGVMPCFLGLGVEAMPPRARAALTPVLYAVFPLGGVIGAWISTPLIAADGWRGVFVAGAAALTGVALLIVVLPLNGDVPIDRRVTGHPAGLIADGRARMTLWLWVLFLLAPAGVYLLVLWMPPLLQVTGVSAARTGLLVVFSTLVRWLSRSAAAG